MGARVAKEMLPARQAVSVILPRYQRAPVVFASPHSGRNYPAGFIAQSKLDPHLLRTSEDCYVDELFSAATERGYPLIAANFPRAYCDPNREAFELDPDMFVDALPTFANTASVRVAGGLGTIAKVVGNGREIYGRKLLYAEALHRIESCYRPYHDALEDIVEKTYARFTKAVVIDCHSMPAIGGPQDHDRGLSRPDIILGDRFGTSCAPLLVNQIEHILADLGFKVRRNAPYAGGFTTHHYGQPQLGRHALQIEINRALYLDEATLEKNVGFDAMRKAITVLIDALAKVAALLPEVPEASNIPLAT